MSKLRRHMPGRRVSRHSKANTLPATVAVPIFTFRSFMGPGRALMGLPISTFPTVGLPPPAGAEDAWGIGRGAWGALQVTSISTFVKP